MVTVYRDGLQIFRGRALYPSDDMYNCRTITCEGERGFFRDASMRPYLFQDGPAAIFSALVDTYNAQVEEFKRFKVGTVTVTDPNNYVRLESESAEQVSDTLDKLVERCGGYITFTDDADGTRLVNWLENLGQSSGQVIEFGRNLLDFARTGANTDPVNVVIPYGAQVETLDEETGETIAERVTIESVNDGSDFIQDDDSVYLRGVISRPVYWDDITEPANLLAKAQQYLASSRLAIQSIELTAVDLSALDKNIDTFQVGDTVTVRSKPHGLTDELFQLTQRAYDLLDPAADKVTLGKDIKTLTGADAAGVKNSTNAMHRIEHNIRKDYILNIAKAVEATRFTLSSLIEQTERAIKLEVSETYMTGEQVTGHVSTTMEQLSESINLTFQTLETTVSENKTAADNQFKTIEKYIRFEDGDIILGEEGTETAHLMLRIGNDRISFTDNGAEVAYITDKQLVITDAHFLHSLRIGNFAWVPRENGNLSLIKVVS